MKNETVFERVEELMKKHHTQWYSYRDLINKLNIQNDSIISCIYYSIQKDKLIRKKEKRYVDRFKTQQRMIWVYQLKEKSE